MFRANAISTPQTLCITGGVWHCARAHPGEHQAGLGSLVPNSDAIVLSDATNDSNETGKRAFASGISKPAASASAATKTNVEEAQFFASSRACEEPSLEMCFGTPKRNRRVVASDNNPADTCLHWQYQRCGGRFGGLNVLASKGSQPPRLCYRRNVKPAQCLLRSPAYPQLARNQRLSGDVKIDALIGKTGKSRQ